MSLPFCEVSTVAVLSKCSSRACSQAPRCLSTAMATSEQVSSSTASSLKIGCRYCSGVVTLAPRHIMRPLVASALHTDGGSVDRNDAASTGPLFWPKPEISLEEAVQVQMEALGRNDEPRPDHGLEVMYYFANTDGTDSGGSLPQYFGFPSDLYHFGHFALKFKTWYPDLINHSGYKVVGAKDDKQENNGNCAHVTVQARRGNADNSTYIFTMSKHARGQQPLCWLTTSLRRQSSDQDRASH